MPLYIATLILGLVGGVYAMLYGMRRRAAVPGAPTLPAWAAVINWTVPAAALFGFGTVGVLAQRVAAPALPTPALAGIGATVAALIQIGLSRWALTAPLAAEDAPEHRLQGLPAHVVAEIPALGVGRIRYTLDDAEQLVSARAIDGQPIAAGDDVVIERLDADGTLVVERWATVETRL